MLNHTYSDHETIGTTKIPCYSLTEILAEKLRALIQRRYLAPRDCYDIWYIARSERDLNWEKIKDVFYKKAAYKNVDTSKILTVFHDENVTRLSRAWYQSLGNHLAPGKLPEYKSVIQELKALIQSMFP